MQDDKLKNILAGTKLKAHENLKYRIMQQIETENALSPKKIRNTAPLIGNMLTTFGIMYTLITIIGLGVYHSGGQNALESAAFFLPVILIASVCGIFWMISMYDDQRRSKKTNFHNP